MIYAIAPSIFEPRPRHGYAIAPSIFEPRPCHGYAIALNNSIRLKSHGRSGGMVFGIKRWVGGQSIRVKERRGSRNFSPECFAPTGVTGGMGGYGDGGGNVGTCGNRLKLALQRRHTPLTQQRMFSHLTHRRRVVPAPIALLTLGIPYPNSEGFGLQVVLLVCEFVGRI